MSGIIGPNGQPLRPEPPVGFYMAGACPNCNAPIFYHGEMNVVNGETGAISRLGAGTYPSCVCNLEGVEVNLTVPATYHPIAERQAIEMLIGRVRGLHSAYIKTFETGQERPNA